MFLETLKQGIKKQIDVGAISANELKGYTREVSPLKEIYRTFGYCNIISVSNMALTINLMLELDGVRSRSQLIPGGAVITLSDVQFTEFTLTNLTGNVSLGGEVYVTVGYEPPVAPGISIGGLK
jgi:hypothetical protein